MCFSFSFSLNAEQEFEGRVLKLNYARPKKKKAPPPVVQRKPVTFNLFVANLSYEATSKDLREFFDSGSSQVVSAEVVFHEDPRKSTGYGFVSFKSKKEANAALSEFQEKVTWGFLHQFVLILLSYFFSVSIWDTIFSWSDVELWFLCRLLWEGHSGQRLVSDLFNHLKRAVQNLKIHLLS